MPQTLVELRSFRFHARIGFSVPHFFFLVPPFFSPFFFAGYKDLLKIPFCKSLFENIDRNRFVAVPEKCFTRFLEILKRGKYYLLRCLDISRAPGKDSCVNLLQPWNDLTVIKTNLKTLQGVYRSNKPRHHGKMFSL